MKKTTSKEPSGTNAVKNVSLTGEATKVNIGNPDGSSPNPKEMEREIPLMLQFVELSPSFSSQILLSISRKNLSVISCGMVEKQIS